MDNVSWGLNVFGESGLEYDSGVKIGTTTEGLPGSPINAYIQLGNVTLVGGERIDGYHPTYSLNLPKGNGTLALKDESLQPIYEHHVLLVSNIMGNDAYLGLVASLEDNTSAIITAYNVIDRINAKYQFGTHGKPSVDEMGIHFPISQCTCCAFENVNNAKEFRDPLVILTDPYFVYKNGVTYIGAYSSLEYPSNLELNLHDFFATGVTTEVYDYVIQK